jgi:hypothetical protein
MEPDFISDLDKTLSNVGVDVHWKRKIGPLELWISPLSITGQEKVSAAVNKAEIGSNIVGESKRVTLSNSIVGVNASDLRPYRNGAPVFTSMNKKGEPVKVQLETYLYNKMANWSAQYIDDVFMVYADLMETFQKENLKEIKFENIKDPHVELQEIEQRAATIRASLGMPQLVEKTDDEEGERQYDPQEIAEALEREAEESKHEKQPPAEDFNPFQAVPQQQAAPQAPQQPVQQQAAPQPPVQPFTPPPSGPPQPNFTMPATLPPNLRRPMPLGHAPPQESSPDKPLQAMPSVPNEVITQPSARRGAAPPKIDQPQGGVNPRFNPPAGRPLR